MTCPPRLTRDAAMTLHRFIYKVLWKSRVLVPLIFLCALIAVCTAIYNSQLGGSTVENRKQPRLAPHDSTLQEVDEHEVVEHRAAAQRERAAPKHEVDVIKEYVVDAKQKALSALKQRFKTVTNQTAVKEARNVAEHFQGKARRSKRPKEKFAPHHHNKLYYNRKDPPEVFKLWHEGREPMCEGKFDAYVNEFALLHNVIIDRKFCHGRRGGEAIKDVLLQPEEAEYYTYEMGCLQLDCQTRPSYYFNNKNHLNELMMGMKTKHFLEGEGVGETVNKGLTILVTRYEYANIYHTMTDWYNAFLLMNFFNRTQTETNVLIVDGHPKGALDNVWPVLFNSSRRISEIQPRTNFKWLSFNILGYNSHFLDHSAQTIPLLEPFREFFLSSYGLDPRGKKLNCDKLSVLFIWRRDYLAHPRNPNGSVSRKIKNERELIESLQKEYPHFHIKGLQIDLFDMHEQLKYVADSDVLIGMHGAGLTHAVFLPPHGGLIEFIPNYWSAAVEHFMAIAQWRNLNYERWVNTDPHNEAPNNLTNVPTVVLKVLFKNLLRKMRCLHQLPDSMEQKLFPQPRMSNSSRER